MLRMRHQPEHVPGGVADAGDVVDGAVRVLAGRVPEDDLSVRLELAEQILACEPAALTVFDGDRQLLVLGAARRERSVDLLDAQAARRGRRS